MKRKTKPAAQSIVVNESPEPEKVQSKKEFAHRSSYTTKEELAKLAQDRDLKYQETLAELNAWKAEAERLSSEIESWTSTDAKMWTPQDEQYIKELTAERDKFSAWFRESENRIAELKTQCDKWLVNYETIREKFATCQTIANTLEVQTARDQRTIQHYASELEKQKQIIAKYETINSSFWNRLKFLFGFLKLSDK